MSAHLLKVPNLDYLTIAKETLTIEANAIVGLIERLGQSFEDSVNAILKCRGRVVLVGLGKSGIVAKKIASTLASTGTPAFFVHAAEASHGDLGMITQDDVVLAVSNSGQTEELLAILPAIVRRGACIVALTGQMHSTLAQQAHIVLDCSVDQEACPLNLAPTASTTATLALGDALAVVLLKARGFSEADFALSHPGGSLGRKLLTLVADVMRQNERIPKIKSDASLSEAILEMTKKGLGMTTVVDDNDTLLGIFTDGDLRRLIEKNIDLRPLRIADIMNRKPKCMTADKLAAQAVHLMETHHISQIVVVNRDQQVIGALNFHDLFEAKVV